MDLFTRLSQGSELVSGMMQRLGVAPKVTTAVDTEFAAQSFRTMVLRCASCKDQGACTRLQAENATLDAAPSYCRNTDRFAV